MNERYEPKAIEPKWQGALGPGGRLFSRRTRPDAPKKYVLEMLPYPSGKMHMGHVRNYLLRRRLRPLLPHAGLRRAPPHGVGRASGSPRRTRPSRTASTPRMRTRENIASFKEEMRSLGYSYDWSREVNTSDPEYYRWNQWFFLKLLEQGLVYRRFSKVNWCTSCLTVIANEQVKDGRCERCDSPVVDKEMPEWAFRITAYSQTAARRAGQAARTGPSGSPAMQRNWIGRREGVEVDFPVEGRRSGCASSPPAWTPSYGCTYLVLAPDHPLVTNVTAPDQRPR